MRRRLYIALVVSLGATATPAALTTTASAVSGSAAVIGDCNAHSRLTHTYPAPQLRGALNAMPASVKEYTNCYDVIQRALLTELGAAHASGGAPAGSSRSGGSFFSTPVIVVIGLLILAAAGFAVAALRRRSA